MKLKYDMMHLRIKLKDGEPLGLIVTRDWKHRYPIVKAVRPNSLVERLGIQRGDRLFAADVYIGKHLTHNAMKTVLGKKRQFMMTILRKKTLSSKPLQVATVAAAKEAAAAALKQTAVKGTRLDFSSPKMGTYCIKTAPRPFTIYEDQAMENSRTADAAEEESAEVMDMDFETLDKASDKCETCDMRTEEELDWDAISINTCQSGKDHFESLQQEGSYRVKLGDITNSEQMKAHQHFQEQQHHNNTSVICASQLKALQEQSDKGEQFMRRYRVNDLCNCMISRVSDYVTPQPSHSSSGGHVDNQENITPNHIWLNKWKDFE
ncbi:hypothetical protein TYRP_001387 [Tyrophagus putrescentiae]|nr:hypothetical protein TYRP_001387 [Tyrophagus putrescentiae]